MNGVGSRVLICEDSPTYAAALTRMLERGCQIDVVGVCPNAEQAIARLSELKPDLVTMDLELPGMSGVDAIEQIMGASPVPILVLSGHVERRSQRALEALAAGALDALPKDELDLGDPDSPDADAFRNRVKTLSRVQVIRHPRARLRNTMSQARLSTRTASVIGICASTGGPPALATVLAGIPATFPIPILVVQHIASGFMAGFATWLDTQVPLPVRLATQRAEPTAGIWVAPDGTHLVLSSSRRLTLDDMTEGGPHRPSADVLLRSLAKRVGADAVAVVLTGMGQDGADGLAAIGRAGGLTIAQDESTSTIFGMPKAAAERGAELILPLSEIAETLGALRQVRPLT